MGSPLDVEFPIPTIDLSDNGKWIDTYKKLQSSPRPVGPIGPVGPMPVKRIQISPNGPTGSIRKASLKNNLEYALEEIIRSKEFSAEEIDEIIEEIRIKAIMEE